MPGARHIGKGAAKASPDDARMEALEAAVCFGPRATSIFYLTNQRLKNVGRLLRPHRSTDSCDRGRNFMREVLTRFFLAQGCQKYIREIACNT